MFDVNNNCSATYLCSHSFISCTERSKQQANIINLFYRKSHWIVIWILFCYDFNVITMWYVHACIKHIVNNCSATYLWSHSFHYCNCNLVRSWTWCLQLQSVVSLTQLTPHTPHEMPSTIKIWKYDNFMALSLVQNVLCIIVPL